MNLMNNYGDRDLEMVRGEGAYLYDAEDTQYLDFTAGIAVCNLGHAHPAVTEAIRHQAGQLVHCSNLYEIPGQKRVAQRLTALSGLSQAFFCNSGAEANEAAMKLARKHAWLRGERERTTLISLRGAFHGRTLGALSITPKPAYQEGYAPLLPGCVTPASWAETLAAIDEQTAACFVEIIQGEGGVHPVPTDVLHAIAARCRETGALLVVDEVQTGVGRTGTFFAHQTLGLHPDIVTLAKGLANGVPIGAVLAKEDVAAAFTTGSHGSTFGGNPLAMAAAESVIQVVAEESFLAHVRDVGAYLAAALEEFGTDISGRGLMWGMTVAEDAKRFVKRAAKAGVLLTAVGDQRVRLVPPLIIEKQHVDELCERLRRLG